MSTEPRTERRPLPAPPGYGEGECCAQCRHAQWTQARGMARCRRHGAQYVALTSRCDDWEPAND